VRELFGTDGIRGIVNKALTPELAYKLARALLGYFENSRGKKVIIAQDTRRSCDMIKSALSAGLTSGGIDVLDAGILPTSSVSYLVKTNPDILLGIVISASHNPVKYNGIKIFANDGFKLPDEVEEKIEEYMKGTDNYYRADPYEIGRIFQFNEGKEIYKNYLKQVVNEDFTGFKIMLDCANGSASNVAPEIYRELGAEVYAYNIEYNGLNINENCGAVYPEIGKALFIESKADIGFTYDGDADRVIVFFKDQIIDGDKILGILAEYFKRQGILRNNKVVGTIMTNYGLEMYLDKKGIKLIRANVGDRYVLETILKHDLNLGGETSGHIILFDYLPTGDGILTSLFLVKIFKHMKDDFVRMLEEIKLLSQVHDKINISGIKLTEDDEKRIMDIAKEVIKDNSIRIIIRRSGTEPVLRITLEGDVPKKELDCFLKDIKEKILSYLSI